MSATDSALLVYATRYALGRSSYAPDDVMLALQARYALVDPHGSQQAILRDIREAIDSGNLPHEQEWAKTLAFLENVWGAS